MILDHLGRPTVITRPVIKGRQESRSQKRRHGHKSSGTSEVVVSQGMELVSRSWTRQRTDCLLELPEETQLSFLTP